MGKNRQGERNRERQREREMTEVSWIAKRCKRQIDKELDREKGGETEKKKRMNTMIEIDQEYGKKRK